VCDFALLKIANALSVTRHGFGFRGVCICLDVTRDNKSGAVCASITQRTICTLVDKQAVEYLTGRTVECEKSAIFLGSTSSESEQWPRRPSLPLPHLQSFEVSSGSRFVQNS
jgi:hypothetical protein